MSAGHGALDLERQFENTVRDLCVTYSSARVAGDVFELAMERLPVAVAKVAARFAEEGAPTTLGELRSALSEAAERVVLAAVAELEVFVMPPWPLECDCAKAAADWHAEVATSTREG